MLTHRSRSGSALILAIVVITVLSTVGLAMLNLITSHSKIRNRDIRRQQIFEIAEAGINYYRWRLAHYPNDFQDGTGGPGPYTHDFQNADGVTIGRYELVITPPVTGSTITTIQSTGYTLAAPNSKKTIIARLGIPSWTRYAVVSNSNLRFGVGTETFGPIHSNGGIRFDGLAHGLVSSSQSSYDDPDHNEAGADPLEFGVHTHVSPTDPLPPAAVPNRTDVFAGGRQFPVSPVDFNAITVDLGAMQTKAAGAGLLLPPSYSILAGGKGYHITLNANDTMNIRIVNNELVCQYQSGSNWYDYGYCAQDYSRSCNSSNNCRTCTGNAAVYCTQNSDCDPPGPTNYGTCSPTASCILSSHSVGTRASDQSSFNYSGPSASYNGLLSTSLPFPANGIVFAQDHVWIDGTVDGARLTVVAAQDPLATGRADIYLNNDLRYTNADGSDAVGLIAQNDILVGLFSEDNLRIDAALLAQKGRVGRPYYGSGFTNSTNSSNFRVQPTGSPLPNGGAAETSCRHFRNRSTITSFGSLGTFQRYGFAWTSGNNFLSCSGLPSNDSGYCARNLNFDNNLTFAPPPSFPTTGQYQIISFDEID